MDWLDDIEFPQLVSATSDGMVPATTSGVNLVIGTDGTSATWRSYLALGTDPIGVGDIRASGSLTIVGRRHDDAPFGVIAFDGAAPTPSVMLGGSNADYTTVRASTRAALQAPTCRLATGPTGVGTVLCDVELAGISFPNAATPITMAGQCRVSEIRDAANTHNVAASFMGLTILGDDTDENGTIVQAPAAKVVKVQLGANEWIACDGTAETLVLEAHGADTSQITMTGTGGQVSVAATEFIELAAGATAVLTVDGTSDRVTSTVPIVLPSYTVATLPAAAGLTGAMAYCTDEVGGEVPVFCDGTDWRRVTDRTIAST